MELGIAFYRGPGGFHHWLIREWTNSVYSHVELVLPDERGRLGVRPWEDGVTEIKPPPDLEHWDIVHFSVEDRQIFDIQRFYERTRGSAYDWLAVIVNHVTPFHIKQHAHWYCSNWVAEALRAAGIIEVDVEAQRNPGTLYEAVKNLSEG